MYVHVGSATCIPFPQRLRYIHKTVSTLTVEFTLSPGLLLAVQYTCFPLSDLTALIDSVDIVLTRPSYKFVCTFVWFVMSTVDMYHVILAGGLQYDVTQVIIICCPEVIVISVGVIFTNVTGATVI